tara:strand:+ start:643 stop:852 length:210 start_codon:yes stop_codon:yes gene_type:complete
VVLIFFAILATCPSQKSKIIENIKKKQKKFKFSSIKNLQPIVHEKKDNKVIVFGEKLSEFRKYEIGRQM